MCARGLLVAMVVGLAGVLGVGAPVWGQTAGMLSFQGLLKDAGGVPVNGAVTLQFRIYDAQTAGALVDMDGSGVVEDVVGKDAKEVSATATKGIVSTKFGPVSAKAFNGSARWLEVRVNGTALTRTEMAGAPATAEQVNRVNAGTPAIRVDDQGRVGIGYYVPQQLEHFFHVRSQNRWAKAELKLDEGLDPTSSTISLFLNGAVYKTTDYPPDTVGASFFKIGGTATSGMAVPTSFNAGSVSLEVDTVGPGNRYSSALRFRTLADSYPDKVALEQMVIKGNGNVGIGVSNPQFRLDVDRDIRCSEIRAYIVRIVGGSDLAEPFVVGSDEATKRQGDGGVKQAGDGAGSGAAVNSQRDTRNSQLPSPQPGMVVVIDPANPGRLKLATEAYDRKVAGIISGANGLKPGMVMSGLSDAATERRSDEEPSPQPSPSKGEGGAVANPGPETRDPRPASPDEHPVALTGRVYVWADASYGPIEPGDMLTTSATAGHAMRADEKKDFPRGCIIGKAMSRLEKGKGLVLMLVQPQ